MTTTAPLTVSRAAADQIKRLLHQRNQPSLGIRIGIQTKGCSGFKYTLEFADNVNPFDEVIQAHDVQILIDPKALLFILGSEMDFVEEDLRSGFVFKNPNEKGRCGCGESFHV